MTRIDTRRPPGYKRRPRLAFSIPAAFRPVPLCRDEAGARAAVRQRAAAGPAPLSPENEAWATAELLRVGALMERTGLIYSASCFGRFDQEVTMGSVTLATEPLDVRNVGLALQGIEHVLRHKDSLDRHLRRLDTALGPAVLAIEQRPAGVRVPAEHSPTGADLPIPVGVLQAYVPLPDGPPPPPGRSGRPCLLVVTLTTVSLHHWAEYCQVMADLLRTLSWR
ncbi:hypothetical protein [Allostreptomyces psammosilenae]|uniref:Uncharacterized protein n=1 Tax=Allostreptomyces psammosilenae TaxID=1892865 RepID=A0A852ZVU5_9ACTN|nr:hypothetical protein [Allostreptomyces psammosilenae]NYI06513.1 hypothetical protein [Allostreptomyces psammosilenae]